ncbi:MAG: hypothetical protein M1831_007517 [Alyxoria varia]|nr:MAG: hypothetical protein M1831_007517 [Alyxoria varia]
MSLSVDSKKQPPHSQRPDPGAPPPYASALYEGSNSAPPQSTPDVPPQWQLVAPSVPLQLTPTATPTYTIPSTSAITHLTFSRDRKSTWAGCGGKRSFPVWDADARRQLLKCQDEGYTVGRVFRDMQDRPVVTVRRNKLSMWRKWSILLPSSGGSDSKLMDVKWHWSMKPHLTATFRNASSSSVGPPTGEPKAPMPLAQGSEEDVAIELESDSSINIVKFTHQNTLIARMRRAAFWPSDSFGGSGKKTRSEISFEIEIARGVDWRVIIAMVSVMDQGVEAAQQAAAGSASSSAAAGAAAGGA